MFRKKKEKQLDSRTASHLLENVFDSVQMDPSSIPFETMVSAEARRRDRFRVYKFLLVIAVILLCFIPLLLISPNFTLLFNSLYFAFVASVIFLNSSSIFIFLSSFSI